MATNFTDFAFSFSHAVIVLNDVQYDAISNVTDTQPIERAGVGGTSRAPLAKSAGRVGLGEGTITWSDVSQARAFIGSLGDVASLAMFDIKITLVNEQSGATREKLLQGCSIVDFEENHEDGADALGAEMSFDFLRRIIDGKAWVR
jgi:hypothetical protein